MLQFKSILIFDRDPAVALELAVAVAGAGGTIVGPATTVHHVRILANKTRLDGVIFDLDADDPDARSVLEALVETGVVAVVVSEGQLASRAAAEVPQIALFARECPHPVLIDALDSRIGC